MHPAMAFFILMAFLALGEFISVKTRAIVPSILIFLILLLSGVWGGILPKEIIELGGFSEAMTEVIMVVIVVNMGSSLSLDSLKKEWKTVLIGIGAIVGIAAVILPVGSMIYDWQTAVVAAPPIAGGFVAAFEMSKTSLAKGLPHLSTIALLLLALQEFPVYFILPGLLRSETLRRLDLFRKGELKAVSTEAEENKKRLIPPLPEKYADTSTYLFLLGLVGMIAILCSTLSGKIFNSFGVAFKISPTIFALLFGIVAGEIGLLERKSLQKANCFGFFVVASVVGVMGGLVNSSMEEILALIVPLVVLIFLGIIGMASKNQVKDGITEILRKENYAKGIKVKKDEDKLVIDLYIIVMYGTKISEIANNVQSSVKYQIEKTLGVKVDEINIYIQGIKVNK